MTILPLSSPVGLFGLGGVNPVSATLAQTSVGALSAFAGSSTIVEISATGRLLSSIVTFQNQLAILRPGSADSGIGNNFGTDFGSLAAEAQHFVDAFNTLQTDLSPLGSLGTGGGIFSLLAASPPTAEITQALNERLASTFDNGDSSLSQLADLGIELQPSPFTGLGERASIDLATLRSAFESDPEGSFSLLAGAVESFGNLAAGFTGESDGRALLGNLLQFSAAQQSLALIGGSATSQAGLQGATDLFALAALSGGNAGTRTQLLAAMNQFTLVSSLLG